MSSRAERAAELLNDKILLEMFELVEGDVMKEWRGSPPLANEEREKLWMQLKALEAVKAKLQSVYDDAKINRRFDVGR